MLLRPLEARDVDLVVKWRSMPDIAAKMFHAPPTRQSHLEWFEDMKKSGNRLEFVVTRRKDQAPVGTAGLSSIDHVHRTAELGILIGETEARRKGYGRDAGITLLRYAFDTLGIERVYLHTFSDNAEALALFRGLGFEQEGLLRGHVVKDGVRRDVVVMGILRG